MRRTKKKSFRNASGVHVDRKFPMFAVLIALAIPSLATACNIPVFRYALENWQPDPYRIAIVHGAPLSDAQAGIAKMLSDANADPNHPANIDVNTISLAEDVDEAADDFTRLVHREFDDATIDQPIVAVYYPNGLRASIWNGALDEANVRRVLGTFADSTRSEISKRLVDGHSAVWVLITTGDTEKDHRARDDLTKLLTVANEEVVLPDQSLIESEEEFRADNPIELRVEFSMLEIDRSDADEACFVQMLLNSEEDLLEFDEPIAIPVFGRGRTYFALVGKGINRDTVLDNCSFVCGACSCQVKQENPGIDTLMAFNWEASITGSAMPDVELPPLTGIGDLLAQTTNTGSDSSDPLPQANAATDPAVTDAGQSAAAQSDAGKLAELEQDPAYVEARNDALRQQLDASVATPMGVISAAIVIGLVVVAAVFVFVVSLFIRRKSQAA